MRRSLSLILMLLIIANLACVSGPLVENPVLVRQPTNSQLSENQILIAPGDTSPNIYGELFQKIYDVVDDYFEVAYSDIYDGKIVTVPKIAPGFERFWLTGSPDPRNRLLATFQTMRNRCFVTIRPGEPSGYWVQVFVLKDLIDQAVPQGVSSPSVFQDAKTVDRQFEVLDPTLGASADRWINKGRDYALEQAILRKIQDRP